jgi:hypothetical protein
MPVVRPPASVPSSCRWDAEGAPSFCAEGLADDAGGPRPNCQLAICILLAGRAGVPLHRVCAEPGVPCCPSTDAVHATGDIWFNNACVLLGRAAAYVVGHALALVLLALLRLLALTDAGAAFAAFPSASLANVKAAEGIGLGLFRPFLALSCVHGRWPVRDRQTEGGYRDLQQAAPRGGSEPRLDHSIKRLGTQNAPRFLHSGKGSRVRVWVAPTRRPPIQSG